MDSRVICATLQAAGCIPDPCRGHRPASEALKPVDTAQQGLFLSFFLSPSFFLTFSVSFCLSFPIPLYLYTFLCVGEGGNISVVSLTPSTREPFMSQEVWSPQREIGTVPGGPGILHLQGWS